MKSQTPRWLPVLIIVLLPFIGWSQDDLIRIEVKELFNNKSLVAHTNKGLLTFRRLSIYRNGEVDDGYINKQLKAYLAEQSAKGDTIKSIGFLNCKGPSMSFEEFGVNEMIFQYSKFDAIVFTKCKFIRLNSFASQFEVFDMYASEIERFAFQLESPYRDEKESVRHLSFYTSKFSHFEITEPGNVGITLRDCSIVAKPDDWDAIYKHALDSMHEKSSSEMCAHKTLFDISNPSNNYFRLSNTTIDNGAIPSSVRIDGIFNFVTIEDNTFNTNVNLSSTATSKFILLNNKFKHAFSIQDSEFPQTNSLIDWDSIAGNKLFIPQRIIPDSNAYQEYFLIYKGANDEELTDNVLYKELVNSYQQLITIFKARGDIDFANKCYIEMKDKQVKWLAYVHRKNPTFNSFFRLQLGRLIKFYTNHGTDPARSITISCLVIIVFGIFYFFFPSDWDTTSKTELIRRYKDFIEKNEKGYVVPLFKLMGGFSLSMINALTLSLNSFVTLGFGNIPTHGLARYICVIEGFIGWFLLSIFTVSLINQVLF